MSVRVIAKANKLGKVHHVVNGNPACITCEWERERVSVRVRARVNELGTVHHVVYGNPVCITCEWESGSGIERKGERAGDAPVTGAREPSL